MFSRYIEFWFVFSKTSFFGTPCSGFQTFLVNKTLPQTLLSKSKRQVERDYIACKHSLWTSNADSITSLPADKDGAVGVVHDVITDASHEGAPEQSHAPTSGNDKGGLLFLGDGDNGFPGVAVSPQELPVLLQNKVNKLPVFSFINSTACLSRS